MEKKIYYSWINKKKLRDEWERISSLDKFPPSPYFPNHSLDFLLPQPQDHSFSLSWNIYTPIPLFPLSTLYFSPVHCQKPHQPLSPSPSHNPTATCFITATTAMGKGSALSDGLVKKIILSYTYVGIWIFLSFNVIVYKKYIVRWEVEKSELQALA